MNDHEKLATDLNDVASDIAASEHYYEGRDDDVARLREIAARVEALGRKAFIDYQEATHDYFELKHEKAAREAEIATVRERMLMEAEGYADGGFRSGHDKRVSRGMATLLRELAASLGGATPEEKKPWL